MVTTITEPIRIRRSPLRALAGLLAGLRRGPLAAPAGVDVAAVEATLAEYRAVKDVYDAAKKRVDAARAKLDGVPAGMYGPWRLKWGKGRSVLDQRAARARLVKLGEPVPMTTTREVIKVERAA